MYPGRRTRKREGRKNTHGQKVSESDLETGLIFYSKAPEMKSEAATVVIGKNKKFSS